MRHALQRLSGLLRVDGHAVSPAELLDAAHAALAVGVDDRAALRTALGLCLAKTRAAQASFERHFEAVFASGRRPRSVGDSRREGGGGASGTAGRGSGAARERPRRPPPEAPRPARGGRPPAEPEDARQREARLRLERGREEDGPRREPALRLGREQPRAPGRRMAPARWSLAEPLEGPEEARLVPALLREVARLRAVPSRRRQIGQRGPIDVHHALRRNLATFGVPLTLPRRQPRRHPPRLRLLVDVSHSAIRASGLFLLAAGWLADRVPDARTLVFVDRVHDATDLLRRWHGGRLGRDPAPSGPRPLRGGRRGDAPGERLAARPGGPGFRQLLGRLPLQLGAPSDYGRVLEETGRVWRGQLDRRCVLIIVGDGRTNRFPACPWLLEALAERVRRVIWLVPEPAERWGTGDSALPAYAPYADLMCEAATLEGLVEGLAWLIRELG